ncbi:16498_t:CDS:10 [Dentiscutata heterogama]|uniref:16498_t:CDS:1 n=1 Tax=Dentiscutata heterogama TaxID=1316150 RepID=A0ACA9L1H4_9GLOM|nr:16498_t:CDS:10 [Dentiscutata heterogama]
MSETEDFGTSFELTENAVSPRGNQLKFQQSDVSNSLGATQLRIKKPPYPLIIPSTQPTGSRIKLNAPSRTTKTAQKLVLLPEETEVPPGELSDYAETPVTPSGPHLPVSFYDSTDAERMPKESREINKYPRATAYCTAEGYYLKKLLNFLSDEHNVQPMLYDECLYAPYHFPLLRGRNTKISSSTAIQSPNGRSFMESQIENYENNDDNSYFVMSENEDSYDNVGISESLSKPIQNTLSNIGEVFFFDYGVVVFWNMTEDQEKLILDDLAMSKISVRSLKAEDIECETFHFQYDLTSTRQPRIFNDMITLKSDNHMIKLTISHAMSQSTKLTFYEWQMESTIERTKHIPKMLAQTGHLNLNRTQITKLSGEMFKLRMNVNLVSNVLDTPEIFWSEPSLEPLYSAIRAYLEISQRANLLNDRCKVISDLLDMLREDVASVAYKLSFHTQPSSSIILVYNTLQIPALMAATIHLTTQQQNSTHPQHVQLQSARGRPVSTPVPMNYPRYPEIPHPPPQVTQSSARRGNMFGPYLLLQTLGEGEFGKVKLGMHVDTGEEVAIKLIRKESVDTPSRLTKIEREIGVLRSVMHPNIVKLYDVFEADRYIGIIMEYASAHRYLKERDACRLFAQLISGVNYLHQKNIVHRDLKLENLLLDRNRNIIITDFGFANQFNGAHDDLMATSCGSPCYAAPELVISEGLYVGSAVDIWSCGVILYAMLSGYLPFDDDPSNPDGDNINLLYKYIINTPLVFPEYVSPDARDLLRKMLVPDPAKRCDMKTIMSHRWLMPYATLFEYSIQELEAATQMNSLASQDAYIPSGVSMSNNFLSADYVVEQPSDASGNITVKRHTIQVEYEYPDNNTEGYVDYPDEDFQFVDGTRLGSTIVPVATSDMILAEEQEEILANDYDTSKNDASQNLLTATPYSKSEKHFSITSTGSGNSDKSSGPGSTPPGTPSTTTTRSSANAGNGLFTLFESDSNNINKFKDKTPQINNVNSNLVLPPPNDNFQPDLQKSSSQTPKKRDAPRTRPVTVHGPPSGSQDFLSMVPGYKSTSTNTSLSVTASSQHNNDNSLQPKLPPSTTPPTMPLPAIPDRQDSLSPVNQKRHKKASSSERVSERVNQYTGKNKLPIENDSSITNKINNSGSIKESNSINSKTQPSQSTQVSPPPLPPSQNIDLHSDTASDSTSLMDDGSDSRSKIGGKRKALSLMVETFKGPNSHSAHSVVSTNNTSTKDKRKTLGSGISSSSSSAAKKVMDWFRRKSLAKDPTTAPLIPEGTTNGGVSANRVKSKKRQKNNPALVVTQPNSSTNSPSSSRQSTMTSVSNVDSKLRIHHGVVDNLALTERPPYEIFIMIKQALVSMGIEIKREGEFKVRCVRRKRKVDNKSSAKDKSLKTKDTLTSEASENVLDIEKKRRKYSSGPFKTLLRRTSSNNTSQLLSTSLSTNHKSNRSDESAPTSPTIGPIMTLTGPTDGPTSTLVPEVLYGDPTTDSGDEIRFVVELCRIKNLPGLYIVDIKRMKGNLWAYKFLYHTLLDKLDLKGKGGYLTIGTSGGIIP